MGLSLVPTMVEDFVAGIYTHRDMAGVTFLVQRSVRTHNGDFEVVANIYNERVSKLVQTDYSFIVQAKFLDKWTYHGIS